MNVFYYYFVFMWFRSKQQHSCVLHYIYGIDWIPIFAEICHFDKYIKMYIFVKILVHFIDLQK